MLESFPTQAPPPLELSRRELEALETGLFVFCYTAKAWIDGRQTGLFVGDIEPEFELHLSAVLDLLYGDLYQGKVDFPEPAQRNPNRQTFALTERERSAVLEAYMPAFMWIADGAFDPDGARELMPPKAQWPALIETLEPVIDRQHPMWAADAAA